MVKPVLAVPIGDPAGIGPEILAAALATGEPQNRATLVLIGSGAALQKGADVARVDLKVRQIADISELPVSGSEIYLLDDGEFSLNEVEYGVESAACGAAVGRWIAKAQKLAGQGIADGIVLAPINSEAMAAGNALETLMDVEEGSRFLAVYSGPLRVIHIFDHVLLQDVCTRLTAGLVERALRTTHDTLVAWGISAPRIGVAGLNPHAHGPQEDNAISPGVGRAIKSGINAIGPISPDTVFRHCIEGRFDVVLAMCHDQGHIAMKTWGFEGNCGGFIGMPYLFMTTGHGTAFDIAGKGIASHAMMLSALNQCAAFAAGQGFLN
jgi:4-phospho-D-threonate 3-dehydrogenase / 4-phospho-D-erythronate 3-dehydrogenase